jgi:hypothetical protein
MTSRQTSRHPRSSRIRPPQPARDDLIELLPGQRAVVESEELAQARALVEDLLALVDAGLIAPVRDIDAVRYAVADDPPPAA